jgi:dipeptidyl aminopeptidase/acylaminoacyl peptidase
MAKIFISYAQDGQEIAEELKASLETRGGHRVFIQANDTPHDKSAERALKACDLFVILVTANSHDSQFSYTHFKLAESSKKAMLPIKIDSGLPPHLMAYDAIELKGLDITHISREIELAALQTEHNHERGILRGALLGGIGLIVAFFAASTIFFPQIQSWYVANFVPTSTPTPRPTFIPTSTPRPSATPLPRYYPVEGGGELVFSREMGAGNADIFIVDLATGIETQLTNTSANEDYPSWSPDGNRIAFNTDRDGNYEIYVMNADGSNPSRLTDNADGDYIPSWSPDGSQIVFSSNRDGEMEIYLMDTDGTNQRRLTKNDFRDSQATFSPDGSQIAFYSFRQNYAAIFLIDSDGSNETRLTDDSVFVEGAPVWSPDGSEILFRVGDLREGYGFYLIEADGSNQHRLSDFDSFYVNDYTWTPEGQILFRRNRLVNNGSDNGDFYLMNADGTNIRPVSNTPEHELFVHWRSSSP